MGCDGGTIPKRNEIVKNKQKDKTQDKDVDRSARWQFCALSGIRLKKPIVACQLGKLYNKTAIIENLLEQKTSSSNPQQSIVSHIKSLKDVKELKLKEKSNYDIAHQASSGSEHFQAQFVCPISGLDMNGSYKFYYILTCGCVLSERAIKQVPNESLCILCSKPYDTEMDLIVLNGSREEMTELKERLKNKRRRSKIIPKETGEPKPSTSSQSSSTKLSRKQERDSHSHSKRFKSEVVR